MPLRPQERGVLALLAGAPDTWVPFAELVNALASSIPDLEGEVRELDEHGYVKLREMAPGVEAVKLTKAGHHAFQVEANAFTQTIHVNAGNVQIGSGNAQHLPSPTTPPAMPLAPALETTMPGQRESLVLSYQPPYLGIRIQAVAPAHTIEPFDEAECQAFKTACSRAAGWGPAIAKTAAVELARYDCMRLWWRFWPPA